MNFVGHVVAAAVDHDDPDVLLGAALPDLLPSRHLDAERLPPAVAVGVAHHRRADAAFHADRRFVALCRRLGAELDGAGVRRGPARAAAHVGVELLLDGVLLDDAERSSTFRAVWERLRRPDDVVLDVVAADDRARWAAWLATLTGRLDPWAHRTDDDVAARVERLIAHRPRLALAAGDRVAVTAAMATARPHVADLPPAAPFGTPLPDLA